MRSLRSRLLAVVLGVALAAVAVTAFVVNRTTSSAVRDAVAAGIEAERTIYEALSFYALTNGTWQGVDSLVVKLAVDYDQRVALTDVDGRLIVDSAALTGSTPVPLPRTPVAFIEPVSPVISFEKRSPDPFEGIPPEAFGDAEEFVATAERLIERLSLAGVPLDVRLDDFGIPYPVWDESDPAARLIVELVFGKALDPIDLANGPFEDFRLEVNERAEALAVLLSDKGVDHVLEEDPFGFSFVDFDPFDPDIDLVLEDFFAALGGAGKLPDVGRELFPPAEDLKIFAPGGAEPALLFLGVGDRGVALPDPVGGRLLVGVAIVGLIAIAAALVASRRVVGPVSALTGAACRMEAGDLSERVAVGGDDEIASLAGAFNAMADSLERQDRLRRTMAGDIAHELRTPLSNIRGVCRSPPGGCGRADSRGPCLPA